MFLKTDLGSQQVISGLEDIIGYFRADFSAMSINKRSL